MEKGDIFYSSNFKSVCEVVAVIDNNNWWFKVRRRNRHEPIFKAKSTPDKVKWILKYKEIIK